MRKSTLHQVCRSVAVGLLAFLALSLLALARKAQASGGPFAVDDAEIVERCQLETGWLQRSGDNRLAYFAPGCTGAGIEWSLGLSRLTTDGKAGTGLGLQAKTVLREADDAPGIAIAAGVDGATSRWRAEVHFAYLALSHDVSDALRFNANLGSTRDRDASLRSTTWGLGLNWRIGARMQLIGEVFGDDRSPAQGSQIGARWADHGEKLILDAVLGHNRLGADETSAGVGLTIAWP